MKKIFLLLLLVPAINFAQEKITTSEEEYKYLTEGLKIQQETGTDLKAGYELENIKEVTTNGYTVSYSLFNHLESKKTKAISIVLRKEKDKKDKIVYLCLPLNNSELLKKYVTATENLGITMKSYYDLSIAAMFSSSIDKLRNK